MPNHDFLLPETEDELWALRERLEREIAAIEAALAEIEAVSSFAERRELWRDYHESVL
jgi:hypothetical protein